ncbi:MAG: type II toxin-antitoxin system ParD family antitoxin [Cyclobacteriaceae bacterium]|nr:type II toxin-antitoxin system ParD family antitoxin [Cyclobacteriaceae bacterium]MCK5372632.1 type II toxin-antitoxin system ParD family antitoxin [Cyclobacteriaceae bacterium]
MNVSFTTKQKDYISSQVKSSDFQNASEVVRDALGLHQVYRVKIIEELRMEIEKGWSGSTSNRNVQDIVNSKIKAKED